MGPPRFSAHAGETGSEGRDDKPTQPLSQSQQSTFGRPPPPPIPALILISPPALSQSPTPILVDFHAAWCGPCRLMSDSVAAAAKELGPDTVTVVKIDADAYPALASRFRVAALPTLLLFRGGAPVDRVEGYLAPADLAQRVRYYCQSLDLKFGRR